MNKYKRLSLEKDEKGSRIFQDDHRYVMEKYLKRKLKDIVFNFISCYIINGVYK